jgi:hypothetical protein
VDEFRYLAVYAANYLFSFDNHEGMSTRYALPVLDKLNHANEDVANAVVQKLEKTFNAVAARPIAKGEEVRTFGGCFPLSLHTLTFSRCVRACMRACVCFACVGVCMSAGVALHARGPARVCASVCVRVCIYLVVRGRICMGVRACKHAFAYACVPSCVLNVPQWYCICRCLAF